MRYLLRNTIRDTQYKTKRAAHPGKANRRPIIGGKPLPPSSTRILRLPQFTKKMLDEIEYHQEVGNVVLLSVGKAGPCVDINALRKRLGFPIPVTPGPVVKTVSEPAPAVSISEPVEEIQIPEVAPVEEAPLPVPEPEPEPEPEPQIEVQVGVVTAVVTPGEDGEFGTEDDVVQLGGSIIDEITEPDTPVEEEDAKPVYTESELKKMKNDKLRAILLMEHGVKLHAKKAELVSTILELQED